MGVLFPNVLSSLLQSRRAVFSLALQRVMSLSYGIPPKQGYREKTNIPGIGCRAIRTSPADSNTRSRRAPRARTRGSEGGRSRRRGRPPHRTRARAPRATRVNGRCWRAGRVDEGEGRTPTTLLGGERPCPARVSTIRTIGLVVWWRDAWREKRMREALRPSERGVSVRTCVDSTITGAVASVIGWDGWRERGGKHTTWTRLASRGRRSRRWLCEGCRSFLRPQSRLSQPWSTFELLRRQ